MASMGSGPIFVTMDASGASRPALGRSVVGGVLTKKKRDRKGGGRGGRGGSPGRHRALILTSASLMRWGCIDRKYRNVRREGKAYPLAPVLGGEGGGAGRIGLFNWKLTISNGKNAGRPRTPTLSPEYGGEGVNPITSTASQTTRADPSQRACLRGCTRGPRDRNPLAATPTS